MWLKYTVKVHNNKKRVTKNNRNSLLFSVDPTGEMSNFLIEDYDAVLKFMNTGMPKKKLKL